MKEIVLKIFLFLSPVFLWGQESLKIHKFSKTDFHADSQFWAAAEAADGTLFFGNNDGVLVYDGEHWQKVTLPNNSSVRSLTKGPDGQIYAGGYDEAGIVFKKQTGQYAYRSLIKEIIGEGENIENIWDIQYFNNRLLYRAYGEIIISSGKTATRIPSASMFNYSAVAGNNYYVEEEGHGILTLQPVSNTLVMAFTSATYNNENIAEILPGERPGTIWAITLEGGLYLGELSNGSMKLMNRFFDADNSGRATSALKNPDGSLYIGSVDSGIVTISRTGEVSRNTPSFTGLGNEVIQKMYRAADGNVWILQNNGLAYADFHSPYRMLFNKASVYDAFFDNDVLYMATTQGVYLADYNDAALNFIKINGVQGQVWSVQKAGNSIIAAADTGLYIITGTTAARIEGAVGFWKITPVPNRPGLYLASQYNGIYLLEDQQGKWILHGKIAGFNESARDILPANEPDTYWICHGYQGVYRVRIDSAYTRVSAVDRFTNANGLNNPLNVNVFRWNGTVVFTTNTGVYTYDSHTGRFRPFEALNNILDTSKNTRKLIQYGTRTWFVQDDEAGYFGTDKKTEKDLFLNLKGTFNRGMECLVGLPNDKMLFGTTDGLFIYNLKTLPSGVVVTTLITGVSYTRNRKQEAVSTVSDMSSVELPNRTDVIRIDFAAPKMPHGTEVQYSYFLENNDTEWSPWQSEPYKEYTHLRPGTYTFKVRSRNTAGITGGEARYSFTVLPRWFETQWAYALYIIVALFAIYGIRVLVKRRIRYERLKSTREAERSKRLLELELEQLKLQRDKEAVIRDKVQLEEDVIHKSKELANYTMLLVQKKDFFAEITDDLKELKDYLRNEESRKKLLEMFQKLNRHRIGEEYMEVFDVHFEKVHHNFFERLKELNPTLTKRELRLCAFVKMNLANKEIAPLLGISLRGVENARYRIRKKLDVANEDNFSAFLEGIADETKSME
jgi:AraC family transcriptional regulator, chitin signaling transcriptional activator